METIERKIISTDTGSYNVSVQRYSTKKNLKKEFKRG